MMRSPKLPPHSLAVCQAEPTERLVIDREPTSRTPFTGVMVGLAIMMPIYAAMALALLYLG